MTHDIGEDGMDERVIAALIVVAAFSGWGVWYAGRAFRPWRRFGSERLTTRPGTKQPAAARIDVALAVASDRGLAPAFHQSGSEHAEERSAPDQPSPETEQLPEASPSVVVKEWARGRTCAMCRGPVTESWFAGHHIALLEPTGMTREWVDVGADRLALALATSLPLCWNCHVAATFRRTRPELVTDRDDSTVHVKQD
jgi:hypothetical protein